MIIDDARDLDLLSKLELIEQPFGVLSSAEDGNAAMLRINETFQCGLPEHVARLNRIV